MRVLHAAAECFPWVKTGGLADVLAALPQAQARAGLDVRLVLPGLPGILGALRSRERIADLGAVMGAARVTLWLGSLADHGPRAYVIEAPLYYDREGNPYAGPDGREWPDNLQRFALLGWVAAHLAVGEIDPQWCPDILHAHDWHAALACTYVATHPVRRVRTVFTIHNLAYQGLFDAGDFPLLGLPARYLATAGLEFHGQMSMMKAGLVYADHITTVSPRYAREIATPGFGCGLEGLIQARQAVVSGILNGVDEQLWDPANDPLLPARYSAGDLRGKAQCKASLQQALGLSIEPHAPLLGIVSRLTAQKGLDLVLEALPAWLQAGVQLAVLGSGNPELEAAFTEAARNHPDQVHVRLGYDEALAHALIAGSDALLVPSRFEPCGLTQLYGLRYGTIPVVRRVGGLADTVIDASGQDPARPATGFCFEQASPQALGAAVDRAISCYRSPKAWRALMQAAMASSFSWDASAHGYRDLYTRLRDD